MLPEYIQHLQGWLHAIKRAGKRTGKYTAKHLKDAAKHFDVCKNVVPAWVMPLHAVYDSMNPKPGLFDVIIVDEASQCGLDAIPLFYISKKIIIVGDDAQISPEYIGLNQANIHEINRKFLSSFSHSDLFQVGTSLFDIASRHFSKKIRLREHFRCMPEIIEFSNRISYSDQPLIPLKQYGKERLQPLNAIFVNGAYLEGKASRAINKTEAKTIVTTIKECINDDRYKGKTMGVITLQGRSQQKIIENKLVKELGEKEILSRNLVCGDPYSFQGDERDVIFISLVAAHSIDKGDRKIIHPSLTKESDRKRFNVAMSRAKDQVWLFHSLNKEDLHPNCFRRKLLSYIYTSSN